MTKSIALPAEVRGYIKELQDQVAALSERAANLAGNLAAAREQNEINHARIEGLNEEMAKRQKEKLQPVQASRGTGGR